MFQVSNKLPSSLTVLFQNVTLFDYIDRPSKSALQNAIRTLRILGAIDSTNQLTDLGRKMYMIPLEPRVRPFDRKVEIDVLIHETLVDQGSPCQRRL